MVTLICIVSALLMKTQLFIVCHVSSQCIN